MDLTSNKTQERENAVRIRRTLEDKRIVVKMHDHQTSRDFISLLPLTLEVSDYAGTEKVADLPRKLSLDGAPTGFDPSIGDFTYYAPWGNLAIFYKDFGYARGLIPLGVIESGSEHLDGLSGKVTVTVDKIEESSSAKSPG